jgi:hypothetical protein
MPKYKITEGGKSYVITVPEGTTKEQAYQYLQQQRGTTAEGTVPVQGTKAGDIGIGIARGLAEPVGALSSLSRFLPGPGQSELGKKLQSFSDEPSTSNEQRAGRFAGAALPFVFQPSLGLGRAAATWVASPLARLAAHHGAFGLARQFGIPFYVANRLMPRTWLEQLAGAIAPVLHSGVSMVGGAVERGLTAGAAGTGVSLERRGDSDDKKAEGRRPEEPRKPPVQPSQPVARRPRGAEYRDNGPAAAQRPDSRWSDPNYFRGPQGQAGEAR